MAVSGEGDPGVRRDGGEKVCCKPFASDLNLIPQNLLVKPATVTV